MHCIYYRIIDFIGAIVFKHKIPYYIVANIEELIYFQNVTSTFLL